MGEKKRLRRQLANAQAQLRAAEDVCMIYPPENPAVETEFYKGYVDCATSVIKAIATAPRVYVHDESRDMGGCHDAEGNPISSSPAGFFS